MTSYPKTYTVLSRNKTPVFHERIKHIRALLRKERGGQNESDFLKLAFRLRTQAIVTSYFPKGDVFGEILNADYSNHAGRQSLTTNEEKRILRNFDWAIQELRRNPKFVDQFNSVDTELWNYRAKKWDQEHKNSNNQ